MAGNKKSFNLTSVSSKTFNLILSSFDYAVTFLFRIRNKIQITFIASLINKVTQTINLKKIKILISQVKLIVKPTQTINLKKIKFTAISKLIGKVVSVIKIKNVITFISTARQKIISSIILKKIKFTFTAILATFFTLAYHDPSTLAAMDVQTLADLDYIES